MFLSGINFTLLVMAFLVLEVLSGLEIDGVSQILTLFKNVADGGSTPGVHIFESLVLIHALAMLCLSLIHI